MIYVFGGTLKPSSIQYNTNKNLYSAVIHKNESEAQSSPDSWQPLVFYNNQQVRCCNKLRGKVLVTAVWKQRAT